MSSGDAPHEEDQVQPLNKLLSRSQEGSWSRTLCSPEALKMRATAFLGPNPGTEAEWEDLVLWRMSLSWRALVDLAGELAWCGGPDASGECNKYGGVSCVLGMRVKTRFPSRSGHRVSTSLSCFPCFSS